MDHWRMTCPVCTDQIVFLSELFIPNLICCIYTEEKSLVFDFAKRRRELVFFALFLTSD